MNEEIIATQENTQQAGEEKTFTQSQLEEIISKRLDRERRASEAFNEVKEMLMLAKNDGLIDGSSYSQMAKQMLALMRQPQSKTHDDTAKEEIPLPCDNTPSGADEGGEAITPQMVENTMADENDGSFFAELRAIREKHGAQDAERLLSGDLFERFAKGRRGKASEIFDDFCLFMQGLSGEEKHEEDFSDDGTDPYSSTAFSSLSDTESVYSGLTKQQMEMAKSAGLSYREYAEILAGIPQKKNKNI